MSLCSPIHPSTGAAFWVWGARLMDVILHLGAHRTATRSLQAYLRRHSAVLTDHGTALWPGNRPDHESPALGQTERTEVETLVGRLRQPLNKAQARGIEHLIVSEPDLIGTVADNIAKGALYPEAGARIARIARDVGVRVASVLFCPRSHDLYWCSALASGVHAGAPVPDRAKLRNIAMARRGWRDVIADVAEALPDAEFRLLPFEDYAGMPSTLARQGLGIEAPNDGAQDDKNSAPALPELRRSVQGSGAKGANLPIGMGRWNPFLNDEHAALRELYADDMMWLVAGAGGLTSRTEDGSRSEAGPTPPLWTKAKGRCDELEERQLARPR